MTKRKNDSRNNLSSRDKKSKDKSTFEGSIEQRKNTPIIKHAETDDKIDPNMSMIQDDLAFLDNFVI